jgi:DNA (cytosine-5)-methyltransferase 1
MMEKLKVLDLFSGIGGFSLGLERTGGFETVAFCEIEEFPRKVLKKHWPEVPCYHDVRELTAARLDSDGIAVDIITGGFPCQDISTAGKKAGIVDGTRSGLWSEIIRLACELRPQFLIVENVANLLAGPSCKPGGWFGRVLGDLAECGYDAQWENIPASAMGLPHLRERVWLVAYPQQGLREGIRLSDSFNVEKLGSGWTPRKISSFLGCARSPVQTHRHSLRKDDGFPETMDRLASLGNAVVPQIPELIGNAILASIKEIQG